MSTTAEVVCPPKLSHLGLDLLHLTKWQVARALAWPLLAFVAFWGFAALDHWILAVLSLVVLSFTTYGSTSHDLVHGTLGLNPRVNDIFLAVLEAISLRSGHAYQAAHLHHHARFPHDDDIEAEAASMSLPRALLEGLVFQGRVYTWALKNARRKRAWIWTEGAVVLAILLGSLAALPYTVLPAAYVLLMLAGSWIIPLITSYLPHDPQASDALHQTRLYRGVLVRIVALDHLYHLEHHLFPAVPHQNWPRLARRLDPWFESAGIRPVRLWFKDDSLR